MTVGPETRSDDGFLSQAVRIESADGLIVNLRVLRPTGRSDPLPLVILLGGLRTGQNAVDLLGNPGNMAIAALDYPYEGPTRIRGTAQVLRVLPSIQRALLDVPPALSIALDWLIQQSWIDPARVELMGVSLGVPFVAVAGAIDSRFRRVWLVHGSSDNRDWIANRLESRIENPWLRSLAAGLLHLLAHGASFRTTEWAPRIAPRETVVIGAARDEQMDRAAVEQLYAAVRQPKELLWSDTGHIRPGAADIVRELLQMARSRIVGRNESSGTAVESIPRSVSGARAPDESQPAAARNSASGHSPVIDRVFSASVSPSVTSPSSAAGTPRM